MGVNSLTRDTLTNTVKYNALLAGNETGDIALSSDFLISEVILNGTASSVVFDVSTLTSTYKHLQLRAINRTSTATTADPITIQFNADTGSNYSSHLLRGNGSSVISAASTSTGYIQVDDAPGSSSTSNVFSTSVTDILDAFNTSKFKTTRTLNGKAESGSNYIELFSGNWRSTSAITSIKIYSYNGGNFISGSRFSLYGSKG